MGWSDFLGNCNAVIGILVRGMEMFMTSAISSHAQG